MDTKNSFRLLFLPAALIMGICFGTLAAIRTDTSALFSAASESIASPTLMPDSFFKAIRQNGLSVALLCILSTTILGILPSAFLLAIRGYAIGKTVGALVTTFGLRGFWAAVCGVFPHNLFYIPFFCLLGICGLRFSQRLMENGKKARLSQYFLSAAIMTLPILFGCVVEGYISAPLIKSILGTYL